MMIDQNHDTQHHDIMMHHDFRDSAWALAMSGIQQGKSEIMIRITEIRNETFKSAT
jgi:hypothetical protein